MLSLFRQTDGLTDRRTTVKQYAPDLLMWGHNKHLETMWENKKMLVMSMSFFSHYDFYPFRKHLDF